MDTVEQLVPVLKTQTGSNAAVTHESGANALGQLFSRLQAQDECSPLARLPNEIKSMILSALRNPEDLNLLTYASLSYHCVAVRYSHFTTSVLQELEDRNMSSILRDYNFPQSFSLLAITVKSKRTSSGELWIALNEYLRQYVKRQAPIRLSIQHCLALRDILEICKWCFFYVDSNTVIPAVRARPTFGEVHQILAKGDTYESILVVTKKEHLRMFRPSDDTITVYCEQRNLSK